MRVAKRRGYTHWRLDLCREAALRRCQAGCEGLDVSQGRHRRDVEGLGGGCISRVTSAGRCLPRGRGERHGGGRCARLIAQRGVENGGRVLVRNGDAELAGDLARPAFRAQGRVEALRFVDEGRGTAVLCNKASELLAALAVLRAIALDVALARLVGAHDGHEAVARVLLLVFALGVLRSLVPWLLLLRGERPPGAGHNLREEPLVMLHGLRLELLEEVLAEEDEGIGRTRDVTRALAAARHGARVVRIKQ